MEASLEFDELKPVEFILHSHHTEREESFKTMLEVSEEGFTRTNQTSCDQHNTLYRCKFRTLINAQLNVESRCAGFIFL